VLEVKDVHKRFGRHHVLKEEVIRPLESSKYIHTFRVGMDLRLFNQYPKNYIVAPAEWIVPVLFEEARKLILYSP